MQISALKILKTKAPEISNKGSPLLNIFGFQYSLKPWLFCFSDFVLQMQGHAIANPKALFM